MDSGSLEAGNTSAFLDSAEMGMLGVDHLDVCLSMPMWAWNSLVGETDLGSNKENELTDDTEAHAGSPYVADGDDILMEQQVGGGDGAHPYSLCCHLSVTPNATRISHIAVSSRLNIMEAAGPIFPLCFAPTSLSKDNVADGPPAPSTVSINAADSPTPLGKSSFSDFLSQGDFQEITLPPGPLPPTALLTFFPLPGLPHPPKPASPRPRPLAPLPRLLLCKSILLKSARVKRTLMKILQTPYLASVDAFQRLIWLS